MKRWFCFFIWLVLAAMGAAGCSFGRPYWDGGAVRTREADSEKLKVVVTIFPYYDFVRQIGGDDVELTMVIPAGMDSHSFEPTPRDMKTLQEADLVICNGGGMEYWLKEALEAMDTSRMTVLVMMDYVEAVDETLIEGMEDSGHGHRHEDGESGNGEEGHEHWTITEQDEHIWTSPVNAMKLVRAISDSLIEKDPDHKTDYEARTGEYLSRLEELHSRFLQVMEERARGMIVVADKFPFRYLADEYDLDYRAAFSGCSADTEPSARTIAFLIDQIKTQQIPAVYYLELSSHRVAEIIREETGTDTLLLHSCHNVTRKELEAGITYLDLMNGNVESLRKGLVE